jgi:hypothetical protein
MPVDLNDLRNAARGATPASQAPEAARSPPRRARPRAVPTPVPVAPREEGFRFRWWHWLLLALFARWAFNNFIAEPQPDTAPDAAMEAPPADAVANGSPPRRPARARTTEAREPAAVTARVRNQLQTEIRAAIADSDADAARALLAEYRSRYPQDPETPVLEARLEALRAQIAARAVSEVPPPPVPAPAATPQGPRARMESQTINPLLLEVEGAREP